MATDLVPPEAVPVSVHVAVLAKAPLPGLAKTRLIPALGACGAARLQRRFTLQTLQTAQQAALGEVTLWCAPDSGQRFFRALQRHCGIHCRTQANTDLGQRMLQALTAQELVQPCIVIGTDCPALTPTHLQQAAHALRSGQDAVFIAAEDGGYVLVGLRRTVPGLFEGIDWSTERVMAQTRERLRQAGARWQETALLWDVDVPADLARLPELHAWRADRHHPY
jgi:rSAM/selenodomain-associated transferase 1